MPDKNLKSFLRNRVRVKLSSVAIQIIRDDFKRGVPVESICERYRISVKELQSIVNNRRLLKSSTFVL